MAVTGLTAVACTSAPAAAPSANGTQRASMAPAAHGPITPTSPASPATPSPTAAPPAPHVIVSRVRGADGSVVTVAAFRGPAQCVLHNGSADPGVAAGPVRAGPAVTGAERQHLLAAFNGGSSYPRAIDRAGFKIIATGLQQCAAREQDGEGDGTPRNDRAQLEKLFLSLA